MNDVDTYKKEIEITDFPLKLRKLAKFMIESPDFMTKIEACKQINLNYNSISVAISKYRKKGINFDSYVNQFALEKLKLNKYEVSNSVLDGALNGTHKDKELFYKLTGDIQTGVNANVNINVQNNIRFPVSKSDVIPVDLEPDK